MATPYHHGNTVRAKRNQHHLTNIVNSPLWNALAIGLEYLNRAGTKRKATFSAGNNLQNNLQLYWVFFSFSVWSHIFFLGTPGEISQCVTPLRPASFITAGASKKKKKKPVLQRRLRNFVSWEWKICSFQWFILESHSSLISEFSKNFKCCHFS